ncbi:hypothetical protein RBSH_05585 [Rhodopirellula baltica SH28]|uniref:Uncharacterized protein n=1 Tax=Rhodopirellula baltica SH28 TaxID=993517 RepID=K5D8I5_RHOBT|nr:hypothetical protein RBSH_05585 [Rhodopirellula baltica SH28]
MGTFGKRVSAHYLVGFVDPAIRVTPNRRRSSSKSWRQSLQYTRFNARGDLQFAK